MSREEGRGRGGRDHTTGRCLILAAALSLLWHAMPAGGQPPTEGMLMREDVICWCPSGQPGADFQGACEAAALDGGDCGGYYALIKGFSGHFSTTAIERLQGGALEGAREVCAGGAPLDCVANLEQRAQQDGQMGYQSYGDHEGPRARNDQVAAVTLYVVDMAIGDGAKVGAELSDDSFTADGLPWSCEDGGHARHGAAVASLAAAWAQGTIATVVPVKVLGCDGGGSVRAALAGFDWVASHLNTSTATTPAVVLVSFSTQGDGSPPLDAAAGALVDLGATIVAAAGNFAADVDGASPARAASVIAVGAEDGTGSVWPDSNQGPGVALFALGSTQSDGDWPGNIPGIDDRRLPLGDEFATEIPSGGATSQPVPTDTILAGAGQVMGTSFAAARVAGAAALILAAEPALAAGEVRQRLLDAATEGALSGVASGSPNLWLVAPPTAERPAPEATEAAPEPAPPLLLTLSTARLDPVILFSSGVATQTVTLSNTGPVALAFTAAPRLVGLFGGWLAVSPEEGSVPGGGSLPLTLTFAADGLWEGRYRASVEVSSPEAIGQLKIEAELLNFCAHFATIGADASMGVRIFTDEVQRYDAPPAWDLADGYLTAGAEDVMWLEVPFQFSHPVESVPPAFVAAAPGSVVEVVKVERTGAMCGEFAARVKVPIDAWRMSSTSVCLDFEEAAILANRSSIPFPEQRECLLLQHRPHARLYAPGLASTGEGLLTDAAEVTIMVAFSKAMDEATLAPEDFVISGPRGAAVTAIAKVHSSGRYWHATLRLGGAYYGAVRVGLRTSVRGPMGQELAPVTPLEFRRDRYVLAAPTGYRIVD